MTTNELIKRLQDADPEGSMPVWIGVTDPDTGKEYDLPVTDLLTRPEWLVII